MGKHKEWRKVAKKIRRKRIRSAAAAKRDEAEKHRLEQISGTSYYKAWLAEQKALEEFREQEERKASILAHEKWLYLESLAQERWTKQQKLLSEEEAKRKEQEALIRREWEKEQEKERLEKEAKEVEEKRKKQQYERLMEQMDSFIEGSGAKPEGLYTSFESNPDREPCPFFSKVGACRFRDSCTRNHKRPGISSVILIPGFYSHFSLEIGVQGEYDTDINLEFDQTERNRHFKEFFDDVTPELEKFGPLVQFRVCSNTDPHLRGNVYVGYKNERAAAAAFKALNGRYYGGRMLSVEFVNIPSWKNAICGLQYRGTCPKGTKCNFLHVFRNPNNLYSCWQEPVPDARVNRSPERDDWRWTPSPEVNVDCDENVVDRSSRSSRSDRRRESGKESRRRRSRDRISGSRSERRSHDRHKDKSSDRHYTPSRRDLSCDKQSVSRESQHGLRDTPNNHRKRSHGDPRDHRSRSKDTSPSYRQRKSSSDHKSTSSPFTSSSRSLHRKEKNGHRNAH